ncbi:MAG TPA: aminoglycoside 6-adenylyltransferase [Patescibacteria group bacterium]|nr:aminoglycoside 6-adenylyltransferase [Patescibacteria group bacterium]
MIQQQFAEYAVEVLKNDEKVVGLAVAGSWLTNEIDEFSDLDLILITKENVSNDKEKMLEYAYRFGNLLSGFTGEHVGEPRLLICLYDNSLLHVDIKFLTPDEFDKRIENPALLLDRNGELQKILDETKAKLPYPDFQWIEDRFWIWVHYALLKIGRGEYFEAMDFFGFLRMVVFGPLLHMKNGNLPRGVRRVETQLQREDFEKLKGTIANYDRVSLVRTLENSIELYKELREKLFDRNVNLQGETENRVMEFLKEIKEKD